MIDMIASHFRHIELEDIQPGMTIVGTWGRCKSVEFREGVANHGSSFGWFSDTGVLLAGRGCSVFVVKEAPARYVAAAV